MLYKISEIQRNYNVNENSIVLKRSTTNTDGDSYVVANLSVIQVDSPSLKQTYPEINLRMLSVNDQEIIHKNRDRDSEIIRIL